jgi:hypothetical protein
MKYNYKRLKCRTLLKLAPKLQGAFTELRFRAGEWATCAVGEAACRLGVDPYLLVDNNQTLFNLGVDFMHQVENGDFVQAKKTYNEIDRLAKMMDV